MDITKLVEATKAMIAVPYCCPELKKAAGDWLSAIGTPGEEAAAKAYVAELHEDVCTIDDAVEFFKSPHAAEHFGAEQAAAKLKEVLTKKANGEKYCGCEACSLGAFVMEALEKTVK